MGTIFIEKLRQVALKGLQGGIGRAFHICHDLRSFEARRRWNVD
jgi:hypothetical protein